MNLKNQLQKILPYAIFMALVFYGLPNLIQDTGSAMFILLSVLPLATFLAALVYGYKEGFCLLYLLMVVLLFLPTLFLFYNISAWIYVVIYGLLAALGMGLGRWFKSIKAQ